MSTLKINIRTVPLFFLILYLLVLKVEIFVKYFLDKNLNKQTLWNSHNSAYVRSVTYVTDKLSSWVKTIGTKMLLNIRV